jgi:hypothetical protein
MPNFLYTSVNDASGAPNTTILDARAKMYFAEANVAQGGDEPTIDEFWFICFKVTYVGPSYSWGVYAVSDLVLFSDEDVTSAVPSAQDLAQGLKDAGFEVVLRHYSAADVAFTGSNITLS